MRLSHKRNILLKQNKKLRLTKEETGAEKGKEKSAKALAKEAARNAAPKTKKSTPAKKEAVKANSTQKEAATKKTAAKTTTKTTATKTIDTSSVNLTPKQQTILDIIAKASTALSAKEVGVKAGQDEAKASAWATSGLKKLVDENLVVKLSDGNKSSYSIA